MAATGEIDIFGTLNAATTKGVIAKASQVKDETQKKMQSVINAEDKQNIQEAKDWAVVGWVL